MKSVRRAAIAAAVMFFAAVGFDGVTPTTVVRGQEGPPSCGPMDVVFVIDTTGSMGGAIDNVKSELTGILGDIAETSGGDYRLALVTFKDDVTVVENFSEANASSIATNIDLLTASGGGDEPEASDEALNTVINGLAASDRLPYQQTGDFDQPFREDALKIIILVTDAHPGGFDSVFTPGKTTPGTDEFNAHARALEAAAAGIKISAIEVPGGGGSIPTIMQDYATTTGGLYIVTQSNGTGTGNAIGDIIAACGTGGGTTIPGTFPAGANSTFTFPFPTGEVKVTIDNVTVPFTQSWTATQVNPAVENERYPPAAEGGGGPIILNALSDPFVPIVPGTQCLEYNQDNDNNAANDSCVRHEAGNAITAGGDLGRPPQNCDEPHTGGCEFTGNVKVEMRHTTLETFQQFSPGMSESFDDGDDFPDQDVLTQYINNPTAIGTTKKNSVFEITKIPVATDVTLSQLLSPLNTSRTFKWGIPILGRLTLITDPPGTPPPTAIPDALLRMTVARLIPGQGVIQNNVQFHFLNEDNLFKFVPLPKIACGKNWKGLCGEYDFVINTLKLPRPAAGVPAQYRVNAFGHLSDSRGLPLRAQDFTLVR